MRHTITFLSLFFVASMLHAQQINWITMDEALEAQKTTPKKILLDAYTSWCGYCKKMDRDTFSKLDVINYINEHFYAVKFNAEGDDTVNYKGNSYTNPNYDPAKTRGRNSRHSFTALMGVRGYPAIVFFDEEANIIAPFPGYRKPQGMEVVLTLIKEEAYKDIKTQDQYQEYVKNFKYTFSK